MAPHQETNLCLHKFIYIHKILLTLLMSPIPNHKQELIVCHLLGARNIPMIALLMRPRNPRKSLCAGYAHDTEKMCRNHQYFFFAAKMLHQEKKYVFSLRPQKIVTH